jgi:hypothetical protein
MLGAGGANTALTGVGSGALLGPGGAMFGGAPTLGSGIGAGSLLGPGGGMLAGDAGMLSGLPAAQGGWLSKLSAMFEGPAGDFLGGAGKGILMASHAMGGGGRGGGGNPNPVPGVGPVGDEILGLGMLSQIIAAGR